MSEAANIVPVLIILITPTLHTGRYTGSSARQARQFLEKMSVCDEECARGGAGGRVCGTDGNTYESEVRTAAAAALLESSFLVIII